MRDMVIKIEGWAVKRNLHLADPAKQTLKLGEEFGELCEGLAKGRPEQIKDSIGDMFVVLTILSMQLGTSIDACAEYAYDQIKDRKGKTINGMFVKEADLNLCPHKAEWDDCPDCRH
jgi:NTP pyrophosphatase (non-canonical NTP hydrolase)